MRKQNLFFVNNFFAGTYTELKLENVSNESIFLKKSIVSNFHKKNCKKEFLVKSDISLKNNGFFSDY